MCGITFYIYIPSQKSKRIYQIVVGKEVKKIFIELLVEENIY